MAMLSRFGCTGGRLLRNTPSSRFLGIRTKRTSSIAMTDSGITLKKKPVASDVLSTVTQNDYVKLAATETSLNLAKISLVSAGTVAIAPTLLSVADPVVLGVTALGGSFAAAIYSIFQIGGESPTVIYNKKEKKHEIVDSPRRRKFVNLFLAAEGVMIAPTLFLGAMTDVLAPATLITVGIMAGPITAAYMNPTKNYQGVGTFACTALLGSICLSVGGLIFPSFGQLWHMPEAYIGIGLMSLFNWYDTQLMLDSYEKKELDPTMHGVSYTLNFINIWIRVISIMSKMKRD
jgi:FtsH-binding integral membrane protein